MRPLVSILIPVYNHGLYVEECLNALLGLNYPNIEVLICDDGSKDNSYAIAENWIQQHSGIKAKLFRQENQGVCKTLNRLIRESSGQYITLCASDDILSSDCLLGRVEYMEQDASKLACIGDAYLMNEFSVISSNSAMKTLYGASYDLLESNIVNELVLRWSVVGPTLLIRRSAYDLIGFYDENLLVEDREFYLRILSGKMLSFWPHPVASYRVHKTNSSRKNIQSRLRMFEQVSYSNIKHCNSFSGVLRLFLNSYKIDLFIIKLLSSKPTLAFYFLYPWRAARKLFSYIVLSAKC